MSGYDVEHGIDRAKEPKPVDSRRPDLSSFYSLRNETFGDGPTTNPHAEPTPGNVTALTRMAADFFQLLLADHSENEEFLQGLIDELDAEAVDPSKRSGGMPQSYFDELERVDKKKLKKDEECPICTNKFLDDPYPLVVRLPCHGEHKFDLECITTWLTLKSTCPLDRQELKKKKEPPPKDEEEEEDYDDYYA